MSIWITADNHFGHANIIKHCNRPFASADEMDEVMIENWNKVVAPPDEVWHLGDFMYRSRYPIGWYTSRLNGIKRIVMGNHDKPFQLTASYGFSMVVDYIKLSYSGTEVILFHYPIQSWYHWYRGAIHLHGHCHGTVAPIHRRMDVGVDCNNFTPISLDEIVERMKKIDVRGFEADNRG